jgi:hypothetical protein
MKNHQTDFFKLHSDNLSKKIIQIVDKLRISKIKSEFI